MPSKEESFRLAHPHIPLSEPDLRGREKALLIKCIDEGWVSSAGPEVIAFERALAEYTGRKHAIAVVNGTAALHLSLMACGVKPGDRVIIPDWTFAATANAVAHCGAEAVLVDVCEEDWALDPALVDQALQADPEIRAVIAVDPVGHAADFDALSLVCARHGAMLIEDAAGAIGATYRNKPCGRFGVVSTFSFNGNKTVTAGGGGMVLTDDEDIARVIRHLSTQARISRDYIHDRIGFNYRMTNVNAAIGLAQFERLEEMVETKRAIAARYDAALEAIPDVWPMPRPGHTRSSCWLYCCRFADPQSARDFISYMERYGVETRLFWHALSSQAPWRNCISVKRGVSDGLSGTVVSLPSGSALKLQHISLVADYLFQYASPQMSN